jgi:nitrite reductase (cytochrome c-552)
LTTEPAKKNWRVPAAIATAAALATLALLALIVTITKHKRDAREPFFRAVELDETVDDPAVWAKNFPDQYDTFIQTVDQKRTRFGGSEALPRVPTQMDPRVVVTRSLLDEDPRLRRMWAGYPFSIDFREKRGHAYMLEDQTFTQRHQAPQPGACMACHSSTVTAWRELGHGDLAAGAAKMYAMPYAEARTHVTQAIACIDCHDPDSLDLRITRPSFVEGIRAYKASQGVADYDLGTATRHEMRTYVCAQCHVEYYFKGPERTLTYPWDKGLLADQIYEYFDEIGFSDWTHATTGAAMLKPQHPEFEMWSQGAHANANVSCVDCHMPYERVGAMKITNHHVRSPLLHINSSCQTCHKASESELLARAEAIQHKTVEMSEAALAALMGLIDAIEERQAWGAGTEELAAAREAQRRATWYLDFVEAENSSGFHAPQEAARVLFLAMDAVRAGHVALVD